MIQISDYDMRRILKAVHEELYEERKESAMGRSQKRKEIKINNEILPQKTTEKVNS